MDTAQDAYETAEWAAGRSLDWWYDTDQPGVTWAISGDRRFVIQVIPWEARRDRASANEPDHLQRPSSRP